MAISGAADDLLAYLASFSRVGTLLLYEEVINQLASFLVYHVDWIPGEFFYALGSRTRVTEDLHYVLSLHLVYWMVRRVRELEEGIRQECTIDLNWSKKPHTMIGFFRRTKLITKDDLSSFLLNLGMWFRHTFDDLEAITTVLAECGPKSMRTEQFGITRNATPLASKCGSEEGIDIAEELGDEEMRLIFRTVAAVRPCQ